MSKTTNILAFLAGAAVGGTTVWWCVKDYYAARANADINSVIETFSKRHDDDAAQVKPAVSQTAPREKPNLAEYAKKLKDEGYTEYSRTVVPKKEVAQGVSGATPYVISPDEFGEIEEYTKISLTYFADGVLADELNEPVDDVAEIVGDALDHFGEYEDDSVFVRNDAKRCDYEILQDLRNFKDVLEDMPPRPH